MFLQNLTRPSMKRTRFVLLSLFYHASFALKSPSFYVYTLPARLLPVPGDEHGDRNTGLVLERVLRENDHVTHVPKRADYFLIPCYPMYSHESYEAFRAALAHVQLEQPYWNATSGVNHVVVGSWDFGLMQLAGLDAFRRIVHLHHFGWVDAAAPWQVTADGRCRFKSGDQCGKLADHLGPLRGVHRPSIDFVVPDVFEPHLKAPGFPPVERTTKVFFAGSGTNIFRDDAFKMFANISGWRVLRGHVNMREELARAVFCLDLGGAGFSTRFTHAIIAGCVPVWIDELLPAWFGVLPVDTFSVRFTPSDLERLPSILAAITPQRRAELQANVRKYAPYYHWSRAFGPAHDAPYPDAFDLLMQVLRERINS